MDEADQWRRDRLASHDRTGRLRIRGGSPRAKQVPDDGRHVQAGQVARHDERGPGRVQAPVERRFRHEAIEPFDGFGGPRSGPVVGRIGRVDRLDERLLGPPPWIGARLEQIVEALLAKPVDIRRREGRPLEHLGEQRQRRREPDGRHLDPGRGGVPAGFRMESGPESFGRLGQLDRVVVLGPLRECPSREDRGAGEVGRLVHRAVADHQRRRDEGATRQVDGQQRKAVREAMPRERGEDVGTGLARRRSGVDDRGHATASSGTSPVIGTYVSTTRFAGWKTSAAASRICSAVTAR